MGQAGHFHKTQSGTGGNEKQFKFMGRTGAN